MQLQLKSRETVPTVAAVRDICRFHGVPKVQPRRIHTNNEAHENDDFIGCEDDFPI